MVNFYPGIMRTVFKLRRFEINSSNKLMFNNITKRYHPILKLYFIRCSVGYNLYYYNLFTRVL